MENLLLKYSLQKSHHFSTTIFSVFWRRNFPPFHPRLRPWTREIWAIVTNFYITTDNTIIQFSGVRHVVTMLLISWYFSKNLFFLWEARIRRISSDDLIRIISMRLYMYTIEIWLKWVVFQSFPYNPECGKLVFTKNPTQVVFEQSPIRIT